MSGSARHRRITGFASTHEGGLSRVVHVWLPEGYEADVTRRYGVLYLHDGQNVFDCEGEGEGDRAGSWGVDAALDEGASRGAHEPWIAVAVEHRGVHRIADYTPWPEPRAHAAPGGARYASFFAEALVPWVDANFRTRAERSARAVAGSSLGGLMALYLAWRYPSVFARVIGLSPSVMWGGRELFRYWSRKPDEAQRIYIDVGSRERFVAGDVVLEYGQDVREFVRHLRTLGYDERGLRLLLDARGAHDERTWRRRLPAALRWSLSEPL